jgi:hypothetical protein
MVLSQYLARQAKVNHENNCQVCGNCSEISVWYMFHYTVEQKEDYELESL